MSNFGDVLALVFLVVAYALTIVDSSVVFLFPFIIAGVGALLFTLIGIPLATALTEYNEIVSVLGNEEGELDLWTLGWEFFGMNFTDFDLLLESSGIMLGTLVGMAVLGGAGALVGVFSYYLMNDQFGTSDALVILSYILNPIGMGISILVSMVITVTEDQGDMIYWISASIIYVGLGVIVPAVAGTLFMAWLMLDVLKAERTGVPRVGTTITDIHTSGFIFDSIKSTLQGISDWYTEQDLTKVIVIGVVFNIF
mmetsp:Transcript_8990/g.13755  ORF Transcript_8990/g.13755 Transcript_8990/m.13755 type:complete len:254 (+) Transcript_8990:325-1086(+)